MHRAIPVANKTCMDRIRQRHHEEHKKRIKAIRPMVNTSEPSVVHLDHLRNNLKREQLLEERYHEIDRENRMLLQKMSGIMKTPTYSGSRARSGPPSLNRDQRKTELMRITQENQSILKRIQQAQPVYNHVAWHDEHRKNNAYLRNTCEYPPSLRRKASRSSSLALAQSGGQHLAVSGRLQVEDGRSSPGGASRAELGDDEDDMRYVFNKGILLKEGKSIGQQYYLVEMATDGRSLSISAYDGNQQRTLELVVNERNHRRLYRDFNGDYNAIAEKLHIDGDQLTLGATGGGDNEGDASATA